MSVIIT